MVPQFEHNQVHCSIDGPVKQNTASGYKVWRGKTDQWPGWGTHPYPSYFVSSKVVSDASDYGNDWPIEILKIGKSSTPTCRVG